MAEQGRYEVIVIGAGIAGSALAVALGDSGLSTAVVEAQSLEPPALPAAAGTRDFDSRVSALTPRSREFLEELGAWPAIAGYRCCPYHHMTVWDAQGTGSIEFDRAEVGRASGVAVTAGAAGAITPGIVDTLRKTRPWALFVAVMILLGCALMVLFALIMMVAGGFGGLAGSAAGGDGDG